MRRASSQLSTCVQFHPLLFHPLFIHDIQIIKRLYCNSQFLHATSHALIHDTYVDMLCVFFIKL